MSRRVHNFLTRGHVLGRCQGGEARSLCIPVNHRDVIEGQVLKECSDLPYSTHLDGSPGLPMGGRVWLQTPGPEWQAASEEILGL